MDAHDALAVRRATAGYHRTKVVVFVFDDDSQPGRADAHDA